MISEVHGEYVANVIAMLNGGVTQIQVNEATSANTCTNLINIPNTVTGNTWTFMNLGKASCTNIVNDVPDGLTDTSATEALYVVGPGAVGSREIYGTSSGVFKTIVSGPTFLGNVNFNGATYYKEGTSPGGAANLDMCYGDSTAHALKCSWNNGTVFQIPKVITATSAAFATATTAGTCVQNTTAVTNAATTMAVSVSPVSTPGVGAVWSAFVSSAGNVTINECAVATSAGGTIAFNIRVTP